MSKSKRIVDLVGQAACDAAPNDLSRINDAATNVVLLPAHPAGQLVIAYPISDQILDTLASDFGGMEKHVATPDGYESVRRALGSCRKARVEIEKTRVTLKSESLEFGRAVDREAKRLTGRLETIEAPLKAGKFAVDDAAEKKAQEAADRAEAVIRQAEEEKLAKIKAERDAEEARLQAERMAEDARLKAERAELERERAEVASALKAERAAAEAERLKLKQEQDRVAAEHRAERESLLVEKQRLDRIAFEQRAKEEAEKKAQQQVAAAEQYRIELEAQRAERDRLAKGHAEETRLAQERFLKDQAEFAEAERVRLEALKPDVEKIKAFGAAIRNFVDNISWGVKEKKAKAVARRVIDDLLKIAVRCESITANEADKTV